MQNAGFEQIEWSLACGDRGVVHGDPPSLWGFHVDVRCENMDIWQIVVGIVYLLNHTMDCAQQVMRRMELRGLNMHATPLKDGFP